MHHDRQFKINIDLFELEPVLLIYASSTDTGLALVKC